MYYRRLPEFEYLAPKSIEEARSLLQKHKGEVRIMAGGTIVISRLKERIGVRKYLIGLKAIPKLDYITFAESDGLRIGCMAHLQSIADSAVVTERFEILATACERHSTPQIRNMGTIGGNVCCRFPSAEIVPPLIALGAEAKIATARGYRTATIEKLVKKLKDTDLVTEIRVPTPRAGSRGACLKYTLREAIDYAMMSVAVMMSSTNSTCQDIKIAFGGESLAIMRTRRAEEILRQQAKSSSVIAKAAQVAAEDAQAVSDIYFSAEYKKELLKVMVARAIKQAWRK